MSEFKPNSPSRLTRRLSILGLSAGLLAALAAAGCASFAPQTPEQVVQRRAGERWDAMRADNFEKAYTYNTPSYRELRDLKAWRTNYGPAEGWTSANVVKVTCESDIRCKAVVNVGFRPLLGGRQGATITTAVEETWLREAGDWYFVQAL